MIIIYDIYITHNNDFINKNHSGSYLGELLFKLSTALGNKGIGNMGRAHKGPSPGGLPHLNWGYSRVQL